jgi:hypothetical protein
MYPGGRGLESAGARIRMKALSEVSDTVEGRRPLTESVVRTPASIVLRFVGHDPAPIREVVGG